MKIAIIGATGDMGYGLALRFAKAGMKVCIGSRSQEKAEETAAKAREETGCANIIGMENAAACAGQDLIVISVPSAGHRATLENLKGVIGNTPVMDVTIPMAPKPLHYAPPPAGSNALETLEVLGETAKVASGFHTVSGAMLCNLEKTVKGDLLVVGNDEELVAQILTLGEKIGLRSFHAGSLQNASTLESLTPMIIGMNKRYKRGHIGIGLTGI